MRIGTALNYAGSFRQSAQQVVDLEKAGLDIVWIAEAYSFDAISQMGYLAAITERVEIGSSIVNVYSRTPALMAMTFAGLDDVSGGRAICGLGASGPQVIEGFHGVPYEKPTARIREYIEVCRQVWRRERLTYDGSVVHVPLPEGQGTGLGKPLKLINHPVRERIPIWWASLMDRSVEATAEMAEGWIPFNVVPEKVQQVWGEPLRRGLAKRPPELGPLEMTGGGLLAIDENLTEDARRNVLDMIRPMYALYVGGMGARGKNFYNTMACRLGYEQEAKEIQDLYLDGKKDEAAAKIPAAWLEASNLVGPAGYVKERVAAYKEAGVTVLTAHPMADHVKQIEMLRDIVDAV